ncbi:hypothetical protein VCHA50P417_100072 [Vibrio chagasii]|nr:hypothetical protein VCHA32P90_100093 [Vibrio chagasii]CAH6799189.1 hypothetical protein VCHA36O157_110071 [Vibrio chagasii]CAH6801022.1 hypothetical protein VCHA35O137_110072 [Vibrio chagasii]CAH6806573.1 hypothetical protein VCHA34P116_120093 [Vibrio chagasii]CAH6814408.1 hypothetical protein VCHA34P112_140066 [Vibrio chagasii]
METYFAKIPYNYNNIKTQKTPFHIHEFNQQLNNVRGVKIASKRSGVSLGMQ